MTEPAKLEKSAAESKKFRAYVIATIVGVASGVADALLQKFLGISLTEQMWDFIGGLAYTYLGVQGVVDVGVRVSSILKGKTDNAAVAAAKAEATAAVGALSPADKSGALADLK